MSPERDRIEERLRQLFSAHRSEPEGQGSSPQPDVSSGHGAGAAPKAGRSSSRPPSTGKPRSEEDTAEPARVEPSPSPFRTLAQLEEESTETAEDGIAVVLFLLGGAPFAVPLTTVREVQLLSHPTPLPHAESELLGLVNLRGNVVPVFDVRSQLSLPALAAPDKESLRALVFETDGEYLGIVADEILGTDRVALPLAQPAPGRSGDLVLGQGYTGRGELVTMLRVADVFQRERLPT